MSGTLVTKHEWERTTSLKTHSVSVRNIGVNADVGTDIWSRPKKQPVLISVELSLRRPFSSAAAGDDVDNSTVHYGNLSKNIIKELDQKSQSSKWLSYVELVWKVEEVASKTAASPSLLSSCTVDTLFPKASIRGDGAGISFAVDYPSGNYSMVLYLRNVKVATLLGVNEHEQTLKQSVIANLWLDKLSGFASITAHNLLEQTLITTIEQASFKTLEALANHVAERLLERLDDVQSPDSNIRLRLEKPSAVLLADAPAIELMMDPVAYESTTVYTHWTRIEETEAGQPPPRRIRYSRWNSSVLKDHSRSNAQILFRIETF